MRILIKGAGDLATGIGWRLKKAGYTVVMTEAAVPTTVRRTVAFSRAVYEGEAVVEGITAVRCETLAEAEQAISEGKIPVFVDVTAKIRKEYQPEILVDAIIAKKNIGTQMDDAKFVIGVGPGFTALEDCNAVVETKRGHFLGRVLWEGSAIPNTGVPGNIGGYTTERIIRATADGIFEPVVRIGDTVEKGQLVAKSGGQEIFALMPGLVRGMLQAGVPVTIGMKCGDIDARSEAEHCYTISDKARAIGGGVLEAVCAYEHKSISLKKEIEIMGKVVDALGKPCPMPVIMTKKEIESGEEKLLVKVDNRVAVENLKKLAASCGYQTETKEEDSVYLVSMWKGCAECEEILSELPSAVPREDYVVFIGKEWIGDGDHELGKNLMRMFFYTLTESEHLPTAVLFMNGGVRLPVGDEQIISHLGALKEKGVDILVCGTCLSFFGIAEELKIGNVSNMYDIAGRMQTAGKVITL